MEAVEIGAESTTVVAATDVATVEAGTVIVTETETGNTAATTTSVDVAAKIETKIVTVETVTARETKRTTENDEGRGKTMWKTLLMQRGKEVMMVLMLRPVPTPETQKEGSQGLERTATALARSHVSLLNGPHRVLHSKFSFDTSQTVTDQVLPRRPSPGFEQPQDDYNPEEPKDDDSETRSVFVSQLAARLTARDLGYFFEDKLGEGTVLDSRIVTDRISRRSKGYGSPR